MATPKITFGKSGTSFNFAYPSPHAALPLPSPSIPPLSPSSTIRQAKK